MDTQANDDESLKNKIKQKQDYLKKIHRSKSKLKLKKISKDKAHC